MARLPSLCALLAAAALLLGLRAQGALAASPGWTEPPQFLPVWLDPGPGRAGPEAPALLGMPPGWVSGDALVVLAPGGEWPLGLRDRFIGALAEAGAAVMELNRPRPGAPWTTVVEEVAAALHTAHGVLGAGIAVVVGRGPEGQAALRAAATATTPEGRRYAAVVQLGGPRPGLAFGPAPAGEAWPDRAPLFCDLLAAARAPDEPDLGATCRASLAVLR